MIKHGEVSFKMYVSYTNVKTTSHLSVPDRCSGGVGCIAPDLSDYQPTVSCPLDVHTERQEGKKEPWRRSWEPD